jgi:hypothetical protein
MGEQDHKLNSMIGLVSTMAEESQFFRSKLSMLQQKISTQDLPTVDKIQYASQMMGGEQEELIDVSDDEDEDDDEDDEDDEDDDDEDDEDEDDDDDEDEDDDDDEDDENNNDEEYIKRLNLTLANDELNVKIPYEEIDTVDCSYEEPINLDNFESTLEETDIQLSPKDNNVISNDLKEDDNFLKNVSITDFGEGILNLGEIEDIHTTKNDYKKLSLNKLREVVVSKGVISDASKLKKNEILKLLGDE